MSGAVHLLSTAGCATLCARGGFVLLSSGRAEVVSSRLPFRFRFASVQASSIVTLVLARLLGKLPFLGLGSTIQRTFPRPNPSTIVLTLRQPTCSGSTTRVLSTLTNRVLRRYREVYE